MTVSDLIEELTRLRDERGAGNAKMELLWPGGDGMPEQYRELIDVEHSTGSNTVVLNVF